MSCLVRGEVLLSKLEDVIKGIPAVNHEELEIMSLLGEGGFARVVKARELSGDYVAVKCWKPLPSEPLETIPSAELFLREIELTSLVHSPFVVRLRGVGFIPEALTFGRSAAYKVRNSIDSAMTRMSMSMGLTRKSESKPREPDVTPEQLAGLSPRELVQQAYREADKLCLFMVLDLCPGGALKSLLLKQLVSPNRLIVTWPDRIRWAGQIAEAMAQLEDAGVWHRDLKLDNCLLTSEIPGEADIKVADLGLAVRIRGGWGGDRPSAEASKLIKARFSYASLRDMGDSSFEGTQHSRQPRSSSKGGHGTARGTPSNNGSVRGAPRASKDVSLHGAPLMSKDSSLHGGPRMSKDVSLHGAGKLAGMARLFQPHSTLPDPPEDLPTVQPLRDPSGNAGTVLYQAPEVLRETEGSVQSDVFSWGILMYEMAKIMPFAVKYQNPDQVAQHAENILAGWRPELSPKWEPSFLRLLEACWQEDPKRRPTFRAIRQILKDHGDEIATHMERAQRSGCCTLM